MKALASSVTTIALTADCSAQIQVSSAVVASRDWGIGLSTGMADWINRRTNTTGATSGCWMVDGTDQREVNGTLRAVVAS